MHGEVGAQQTAERAALTCAVSVRRWSPRRIKRGRGRARAQNSSDQQQTCPSIAHKQKRGRRSCHRGRQPCSRTAVRRLNGPHEVPARVHGAATGSGGRAHGPPARVHAAVQLAHRPGDDNGTKPSFWGEHGVAHGKERDGRVCTGTPGCSLILPRCPFPPA